MVVTARANWRSVALPDMPESERRGGAGTMAGAVGVRARTSRHQPVSTEDVCRDFAKVLAWTLNPHSSVHPAGEVTPVVGFDDSDGGRPIKTRGGQPKSTAWDDVSPKPNHTPLRRSNSRRSADSVTTEASVHELSGDHHRDEIAVQQPQHDERNGVTEAKKEKKTALKRVRDRIVRTITRRRTKEEKREEDRESEELPRRRRGGSFFRSLRHSIGRKSKKRGGSSDIGGLPAKESEAPQHPETPEIRDGVVKPSVGERRQGLDDGDSIGSCSLAGVSRKFSLPLPYADEDSGDQGAMVSSWPQPGHLDVTDGGKGSPPVKRHNSIEVDGGEDGKGNGDLHDERLKHVAEYLRERTEPDIRHIGQEIRRIGDAGDTWLRDAPENRETRTVDWDHLRAPPDNQDLPTEPYDAQLNELEQELVEVLRDKADNVTARVCAWFSRTVESFIGDQHTWSQVRFFTHFTVLVCRTVQDTGLALPRLTHLAEDLFQRTLAPWVAEHGGIENVAGVPRTRDSGEVD